MIGPPFKLVPLIRQLLEQVAGNPTSYEDVPAEYKKGTIVYEIKTDTFGISEKRRLHTGV